jgi:hypothetical protein
VNSIALAGLAWNCRTPRAQNADAYKPKSVKPGAAPVKLLASGWPVSRPTSPTKLRPSGFA